MNHHLAWYSCSNKTVMDKYVGIVFPCYDPNNSLFFLRKNCVTFEMVTVLNNEPVIFPYDLGITLNQLENPYFLIAGHFINPYIKDFDIRISYRVWLTSNIDLLLSS